MNKITHFNFVLLMLFSLLAGCRSSKSESNFPNRYTRQAQSISFEQENENVKSTMKLSKASGIKGKALYLEEPNNLAIESIKKLAYPYVISLWAKGTGWLVSNGIKCSPKKTWGFEINKHHFNLIYISNNKTQSIRIKNNVNISDWNHITLRVYSNKRIDLFCNGLLVNEIQLASELPSPNSTFYLGSNACSITEGNYSNAFLGLIDEFRIFSKPLTNSEVRELFIVESQGLYSLSGLAKSKNKLKLTKSEDGILSWEVKGSRDIISHFQVKNKDEVIDNIPFTPNNLKYNYINLNEDSINSYQVNAIAFSDTLLASSNVINHNKNLKTLINKTNFEGYTKSCEFGNHGQVYKVTNLNDTGPGSLRYGLEKIHEPRIIIFEVGGLIKLKKPIKINSPYVSVYGQTAPGSGISIIDAGITIQSHDVLLQHLTIRPGDSSRCNVHPIDHDGITILGTKKNKKNVTYNIVIDHCSISWAKDENLSLWYNGIKNITISNSIISEGLNNSDHPKGPHSKGLLIGSNCKNIAVIKNLFFNNVERNPTIQGNSDVLLINNIIAASKQPIRLEDVNNDGKINAILKFNLFQNTLANKVDFILSPLVTNPTESNNILSLDNITPLSISKNINNNIKSKEILNYSIDKVYTDKEDLLKYFEKNVGANPSRRTSTDLRVVRALSNYKNNPPVDCIFCDGTSIRKEVLQLKKSNRSIELDKEKPFKIEELPIHK